MPSPQSVLPPSLLVVDGWVGQMERYFPVVGLLLALRTTQYVLPVVGFAAWPGHVACVAHASVTPFKGAGT